MIICFLKRAVDDVIHNSWRHGASSPCDYWFFSISEDIDPEGPEDNTSKDSTSSVNSNICFKDM